MWAVSYPALAEPANLVCRGMFGKFANNMLIDEPARLSFVIDWQVPVIVTDTGRYAEILALNPYEIAFVVHYDDYQAHYRINRVDGTISQATPLGGLFHGQCELNALRFRF